MKKRIVISTLSLIALISLISIFVFRSDSNNADILAEAQAKVLDREAVINIESGMTFSTIAEEAGLDNNLMMELLEASADAYDLSTVRAGKDVKFYFDSQTDEFKKLIYQVDPYSELFIEKNEEGAWQAEVKEIEYDKKIKVVSGTIESSLYESAVEQNVDIRAIISLADVFAWTVDFGMGIRKGDTYKFIFEELYRDGKYVMPGEIIAARFVNDGKIIEGYYFAEGEDEDGEIIDGYYDPEGQSLQKIFLKNPVAFKYITSGYTTGLRYISAFDISTGHRAIDYAANIGTPVKAVGDGQVVYAGWKGSYGNFVSVRHNSIYTTNYAHLSKIYVSYGEKVDQGEIIGAVGSTGLSTGPHLHFEMVKNGTKINPLTVDLPSDKAVSPENLDRFKEYIKQWQEKLN